MAIQRVDTAEQFEREYPRCRKWLIEALSHTREFTERDILNGIDDRSFLLWTSTNAACVTQITNQDDQIVCLLVLVGGQKGKALREILVEGQAAVSSYAKSHSCTRLAGSPRKEWSRLLINDGFKVDNKNTFYKDF